MGKSRADGYYAVDIPQGELSLEYCDITSDSLACVAIHGGEAVGIVSHCQIQESKDFGNALSGIQIGEGGNPVVQKCTIKQNGYEAVYVHDGGAGTAICEITLKVFGILS